MDDTMSGSRESLSVSVVFPCLNEEAAIGDCVRHALGALAESGLFGEVLVIDNGSTDRSAEIARSLGARVVLEERRGYGSAHLRGIEEARGEVLVMLDADGTYPAEMIADFVAPIREARKDLVIGNRFGGALAMESMPWLNRFIGNPVLSGLTRLLFRVGVKDLHCGMRAISRTRAQELVLQAPGMEFATEMIVKAADRGLQVAELPIPYRPRVGDSKLNRWRDGWRHLEFMLVFSPALLFLLPGLAALLLGLLVQVSLVGGPVVAFGRPWDLHSSFAGLLASLAGGNLLVLGAISAGYAHALGMRFAHSRTARWVARNGDSPWRWAGLALLLAGASGWATVFVAWWRSGFGALSALPILSLASSLLLLGTEFIGAAFILNLIHHGRTTPR